MQHLPKIVFFLGFLSLSATAGSCKYARPIRPKPIIFNEERITLTREYQQKHYGINADSIEIDPKIIVLHWTTVPTLEESFEVLRDPRIKKQDRPDIEKQSDLNVSAHFLVDREGQIYQLMPDYWMARHVIGLNHYAIGIENVGGIDNREDLTHAQVQANVYLVCYLKHKYPQIQYLIGHQEYTLFQLSSLWQEKDVTYLTKKDDPGVRFLTKVRTSTKNLKLADKP